MKANRFFPHHLSLVGLTAFLLSALSLQAQTFSGPESPAQLPSDMEVNIFPLSNVPSAIKVIFNNPTGGIVRIAILDDKGKVHYEELAPETKYRRRFDLSLLPEGKYTIDLSKQNEHYTQNFSIDLPVNTTRIAMANPLIRQNPVKPSSAKLAISQ